MRKVIVTLLALSACTTAHPQPQPPLTLDRNTQAGMQLRKGYGADAEPGPTFIHIETIATHHTSVQCSTLLKPSAPGHWTLSRLCQTGSGLLKTPTEKAFDKARALSPAEDARIEAMLADKQLYRRARPKVPPEPPAPGAPFHVIEIRTARGHIVAEAQRDETGTRAQALVTYILNLPL